MSESGGLCAYLPPSSLKQPFLAGDEDAAGSAVTLLRFRRRNIFLSCCNTPRTMSTCALTKFDHHPVHVDRRRGPLESTAALQCNRWCRKLVDAGRRRLEKQRSTARSLTGRARDGVKQLLCCCDKNSPSDKVVVGPADDRLGFQNNRHKLLGGVTWCRLAYWEEQTRVGRLFPVSSQTVEIFHDLPRTLPNSQALSIRSLTREKSHSPSESTVRTRDKIGLGVLLSLDGSLVRLYNRSDIPVFINSPTLEDFSSRHFAVYKVLPGYSMVVFDRDLAARLKAGQLGGATTTTDGVGAPASSSAVAANRPFWQDGPYDVNALRLSFGKGWGGKYSRQVITCCPCWIEVLLTPPR